MVTRRTIPARRAARTPAPDGRRRAARGGRLAGVAPRLGRIGLVLGTLAAVGLLVGGLWTTRALTQESSPPTALAATTLSPTAVKISWKGPEEEVDRFVVRVGLDRALSQETIEIDSMRPGVTLEDLAPADDGGERYFRVDAIRDGEVTSSRTGRFVMPPAEMGEVEVAKRSATGVRLTWEDVANAQQYDVQAARDEEFAESSQPVRTASDTPRFVTTDLADSSRYWFRVRPVNGDLVGEWGEPVSVRTRSNALAFHAGTYNVCSEACGGYGSRAPVMASLLQQNELDVFGLQEAGGKRVGPQTASAFSGGPQGFQLASGGQKARYIFFRPELFTQDAGGSIPLGHNRWATWARFTIDRTKQEFYFVSVHLESGKGNDGRRASETRTLLNAMSGINAEGLPVVYAGDFNSGRHRPADSPGSLMGGAGLLNTVDEAENPENRQFNSSFPRTSGVLRSGALVDHIFTSDDFSVLGWKQLVRANGGSYAKPFVSDHHAIRARISLATEQVDVGKATKTVQVPDTTP